MLQFTIPAGSKGVVLGSQVHSENECVLPRRSVFRIDSIEKDKYGKGRHHCHVTLLGVREDA
jgi:hypothetical protein